MDEENSSKIKDLLDLYQEKILFKYDYLCEKNHNKIPYTLKADGSYNDLDYIDPNPDMGISWWTNGFFAGILWQMYKATGQEKYKDWARYQEERLDQCFELFNGIHHDAGFMWLLSSGADYELTGDERARTRAMHAATILAGRFNANGNFIRAWNGPDGGDLNSVIVDSLMNMSLLYWAYDKSKDPRFKAIAIKHTDTLAEHILRSDGSTRHILKFDPDTGKYLNSLGGQGMGHGTAWSRGQAWALYGFTNAYRHTGKFRYLELAKKAAEYFIGHIREDGLIPVDFCQPIGEQRGDNSALCIAASGLIDLAAETKENKYAKKAVELLENLINKNVCLDKTQEAVVNGCAVSYGERQDGPDTLIYADYYLLEAIMKSGQKALMIW